MTPSGASSPLASSIAHSPLFKLSPELRNKIYCLVLIQDDDEDWMADYRITVDKATGVPEPALLLTNKVLRAEASGIFYYENNFCCNITDFDPAPVLLLQSKLAMSIADHPMQIDIERGDSSVNWKNLVSWLHMCHRGECPGLDRSESGERDGGEARLLEGLFELESKRLIISPDALDLVLVSIYCALEEINMDWW